MQFCYQQHPKIFFVTNTFCNPTTVTKIDVALLNSTYQIITLVLDHLAMDDSIWGNLFSADDPMAPQLEFRGGNGHTGKSIIIRSGTEPKPLTQNFLPKLNRNPTQTQI